MCGSSDEKLENLQAKSTVGGQPASKGNADIFFRNFRRVVLSMARESTPAEETPPEVADSVPGGLFQGTPDVSSALYSLRKSSSSLEWTFHAFPLATLEVKWGIGNGLERGLQSINLQLYVAMVSKKGTWNRDCGHDKYTVRALSLL